MTHQDYFTHFEPSQSLGGANTGDPQEKTPDHPQAEIGLSHMWPELGSNPQRWDDKRFRALKISSFNHSLKEQSDLVLHCLPFWLLILDPMLYAKTLHLKFRTITVITFF